MYSFKERRSPCISCTNEQVKSGDPGGDNPQEDGTEGMERQSPRSQGNRPCHPNPRGIFLAAFALPVGLSLGQTLLLEEPSRKGGRGRRGGSNARGAQGPASTTSKSIQASQSHDLPPTCWLMTLSLGSGQLPPTDSATGSLHL